MGCCGNSGTTKKLDVFVDFRPTQDRQFRIRIICDGSAGRWTGSSQGTYDFGTLGCGCHGLEGSQTVKASAVFVCTDGSVLSVGGYLNFTVGNTIYRYDLPPETLSCFNGGPTCSAMWTNLFFGNLLGSGMITLKNLV